MEQREARPALLDRPNQGHQRRIKGRKEKEQNEAEEEGQREKTMRKRQVTRGPPTPASLNTWAVGGGPEGGKRGCADRGAGEATSSVGDSHEEPGGSGSAGHTDGLRAGVLSLISCPLSFTIRW